MLNYLELVNYVQRMVHEHHVGAGNVDICVWGLHRSQEVANILGSQP